MAPFGSGTDAPECVSAVFTLTGNEGVDVHAGLECARDDLGPLAHSPATVHHDFLPRLGDLLDSVAVSYQSDRYVRSRKYPVDCTKLRGVRHPNVVDQDEGDVALSQRLEQWG